MYYNIHLIISPVHVWFSTHCNSRQYKMQDILVIIWLASSGRRWSSLMILFSTFWKMKLDPQEFYYCNMSESVVLGPAAISGQFQGENTCAVLILIQSGDNGPIRSPAPLLFKVFLLFQNMKLHLALSSVSLNMMTRGLGRNFDSSIKSSELLF